MELPLPIPELIHSPVIPPEPHPLLIPSPPQIPSSILLPSWLNEQTLSLTNQELHPPFPQGNDIIVTLLQLNEAGEGLTDEVLLEWALDMLHSPENWRWLWSLEPATIPLSSPTLPNPLLPPLCATSNANPSSTFTLTAPNTSVPSVNEQHPATLSTPAPCALAPYLESLVMWAPVAQPLTVFILEQVPAGSMSEASKYQVLEAQF